MSKDQKMYGKIITPFCHKGKCDTNFLVPALLPGQIVIMDNATFHKSELTKNLIEQANCKLVFLPAYSPVLILLKNFG
jgi:transposase